MNKNMLIISSIAILLSAGCKTTQTETKPLPWREQSAYFAGVRDPRRFGYSIYQTPDGKIDYRGGCRLHPRQGAVLSMKTDEPLRPVGMLKGNFGFESPLLFDFASVSSWMEFELARKLGAQPIGEGSTHLVKLSGEEIAGCLSIVPTIRLGQLYIENPLVYVRMATGFMGPLARGIEKPELTGVLGWDMLRRFGQIQLNYAKKQIAFLSDEQNYMPDPTKLVATVPLVKHAGVCAVRGTVDGKSALILIDPAGDFEIATDQAAAVSSVQLDAGLTFTSSEMAVSPGGIRIGARLLQRYCVTVCPAGGLIYFEKPDAE